MIKDETIIRDLRRIMNDRAVCHRHRNIARRAADIINRLMGDEAPDLDADQTNFRENYDAIQAREKMQLDMQGVDLGD